jgi:hypothetical protein
MQHTKNELIKLWGNNDKRREFFKNYRTWGVWLTVSELGQTYYQYVLPDSTKILAMEYIRENYYPHSDEDKLQTITVYYLWDGEHFIPNAISEFSIADKLKTLKLELQKELRES